MTTISRSGRFFLSDDATKKYGKRIKVEINGDQMRLTITDVTHSDEATFLVIAEIGLRNQQEIGKITLDVSGALCFLIIKCGFILLKYPKFEIGILLVM